MNKSSLIQKYFQKKGQLTVKNREYQHTISNIFKWLTDNDKVTHDKTSKYFPTLSSQAKIIAKQEGILSGIEEIEFLLKKFTSLSFKSNLRDGSQFKCKDIIAEIKGKSHEILGYERTVLNILQRMSGIATETHRFIKLIHPSHHVSPITNSSDSMHLLSIDTSIPYIAATRKTPWMSLDKKAVAVGGGLTHRLNLSDGILIKDNHLTFVSIENAINILTSKFKNEFIEIEVTNTKQAYQIINTFSKLKTSNHLGILLDNFTPQDAKNTLNDLKKTFDLSEIIFEASGGIDENNISEWSKTGVDIISLGALTHSSKAADLSMEFTEFEQN